jgi:hypothetical protein
VPCCLSRSRFVWNGPNGVTTTWDTMFEKLVEYKQDHGDTMVPTHKNTPKNLTKLSNWVSPSEPVCVLRKSVQTRTRSVGGGVDRWQLTLLDLLRCFIFQVNYQRKKYVAKQKAVRGVTTSKDHKVLTDDEERRLTEIGFYFIAHDKKTWEQQYETLKEFVEGHGHARVPLTSPENKTLGSFVHTMRRYWKLQLKDPKNKKAQSLTAERVRLLNEIGFVWDARTDGFGSGGGAPKSNKKRKNKGSAVMEVQQNKHSQIDDGRQMFASQTDGTKEGGSGSGTAGDREEQADVRHETGTMQVAHGSNYGGAEGIEHQHQPSDEAPALPPLGVVDERGASWLPPGIQSVAWYPPYPYTHS